MQDEIIVICGWDNPNSPLLWLQDFIADGVSFLPIFSDEAAFKRQAKGSGFENHGLAIARSLLLSILRGDEVLIMNPGDPNPVKITKADLARG